MRLEEKSLVSEAFLINETTVMTPNAFQMTMTTLISEIFQMNTSTATPTHNNHTNSTLTRIPSNEDEGLITDELKDEFTFASQCVIIPLLVVFGIIGNVLSLIVLSRRKLRRSSTTILLIGLAVSDTLHLVSTMVRKSTCIIGQFDSVLSYKYYVMSFPSMFYINICFSRISTLLVAVMSMERLVAVLSPLKVRLFSTKTKMIAAVIIVFVFTFACLVLLPIQFDIKYRGDMPLLKLSSFYTDNMEIVNIYNNYITYSVFRWLPKLIVIICNLVIVTLIWKRRIPSENAKHNPTVANYTKTQRRITSMLVTVAIIFVVTLLPGDIFLVSKLIVDGFGLYKRYHNLFIILSDVTVTFEIINSSINFVIYMVLNSTFSEVYLALFCRCLSRNKRVAGLGSMSRLTMFQSHSSKYYRYKMNESISSISRIPSPSAGFSFDVDNLNAE